MMHTRCWTQLWPGKNEYSSSVLHEAPLLFCELLKFCALYLILLREQTGTEQQGIGEGEGEGKEQQTAQTQSTKSKHLKHQPQAPRHMFCEGT